MALWEREKHPGGSTAGQVSHGVQSETSPAQAGSGPGQATPESGSDAPAAGSPMPVVWLPPLGTVELRNLVSDYLLAVEALRCEVAWVLPALETLCEKLPDPEKNMATAAMNGLRRKHDQVVRMGWVPDPELSVSPPTPRGRKTPPKPGESA